jgi:hypothetical protein
MDLTTEIFRFCEARRSLWNIHFAPYVESITDPTVDAFLEIQKLLFRAIVLERCGENEFDVAQFGSRPIDFLRVNVSTEIDKLEILVAQSRHPTQWEKRLAKRAEWEQRIMLFVDFFDWYPQDPKGRCSYPFVEVESRLSSKADGGERWLLPSEYITAHLRELRKAE